MVSQLVSSHNKKSDVGFPHHPMYKERKEGKKERKKERKNERKKERKKERNCRSFPLFLGSSSVIA